jgi:hypothetical protein
LHKTRDNGFNVPGMENQDNDTLRRPEARDKGFYVPPKTHVTSRGLEQNRAPREVTWVEGGRKILFLSEGGGVMTFFNVFKSSLLHRF